MPIAEKIQNEPVQVTHHKDVRVVRKRGGGCRNIIISFIFILSCLFITLLCIGVTWATGHLQSFVCDVTLSNSPISQRLNCSNFQEGVISNPDSEFPISVAEDDSRSTDSFVDVAKVYEQAIPSVVGIAVQSANMEGEQVIGTGFVISANGLIATNRHVVSDVNENYLVKFSGDDELVRIEEIFRDPTNDIAIVKVDKANLKALTLANSEQVKPGQSVVAIGNPLGSLSSTVTSGIVSGVNREVRISSGGFLRTDVERFEDTIQTDAAINPGNSGGPLLNSLGHVIGINFATIQGFDNLSFAIPSSYLRVRLEELDQFGQFRIPYLGIEYRARLVTIGSEVLVGAQVVSVDPTSRVAGVLRRGDIILEFDGASLEEESLARLIQKQQIGSEVDAIIIRDGERLPVTLEISLASTNSN